jgi:hypothetical protein
VAKKKTKEQIDRDKRAAKQLEEENPKPVSGRAFGEPSVEFDS